MSKVPKLFPEEEPQPIGEALAHFSERPLTPAEKLGAALRVINDPDLTPEEKLRLEKQILRLNESDSTENASSSSEPSAASSATRSGNATSSPAASPSPEDSQPEAWTPDPPQMRVEMGDDQAFVRESCLRFLTILDTTMQDMVEMQKAMTGANPETMLGSLALQQQMVLYEAARTVALQLHMMAEAPVPELEIPHLGLIDSEGNRLRKKGKPHA